MSGKKNDYIIKINRVIDYIENNLDDKMSLKTLAGIADFSAFHFHRIFRALIDEPLNKFIQRVRIEKAASLLIQNPEKSIIDIAFDCGFSSQQFFSKTFREYFKTTARLWRIDNLKNFNKKNINSKILKEISLPVNYYNKKQDNGLTKKNLNVKITDLSKMHLVYIRHIGPYKGDARLFEKLFTRFFKWAHKNNLLGFPESKVICMYHDNYDITAEEKLRISLGITVPFDTKIKNNINTLIISGGRYAVAHFELFENEFQKAWDDIYKIWLPESGYQPANKPAFEICYNDPRSHPQGKYIIDICIPVEPL